MGTLLDSGQLKILEPKCHRLSLSLNVMLISGLRAGLDSWIIDARLHDGVQRSHSRLEYQALLHWLSHLYRQARFYFYGEKHCSLESKYFKHTQRMLDAPLQTEA